MAFSMTTQGPASVLNPAQFRTSGLVPPLQLADQTFTTLKVSSAVQNLGFGCSKFRVVIYLKTLVLGATGGANAGPLFFVEVADNAAMTTNLTIIQEYYQAANIPSTTEVQCFEMVGMVPVASKQYLRVTCDPTLMGGGSSGTYDALVEAIP